MNWEAIGAIGELLGALAVVVTLVYLAAQIRHSTLSSQAATHQQAAQASSDILMRLADENLVTLTLKARHGLESLSDAERLCFVNFTQAMFNYYEILFYAKETGSVHPELWASRTYRIRGLFGIPGIAEAWDERRLGFGRSFRDFVDQEIRVNPDPAFLDSRLAGADRRTE